MVKKDSPAKTIQAFAAHARANPGQVNNATNGQASMVHLLGEPVPTGVAIQLTQVHDKGAAPATMDMLAGVIDSNVEALTGAVPNPGGGGRDQVCGVRPGGHARAGARQAERVAARESDPWR